MEVLRHHDISHNHEAIALPGLFEDRKESVAAAHATELRPSVITRASDKVQVMGAVSAMESGGHEGHGTSDSGTRPCKKRKDGAPSFQTGKERSKPKGGPPAPPPPPPPDAWDKLRRLAECYSGTDPDNVGRITREESKDSTDSTKETEGQSSLRPGGVGRNYNVGGADRAEKTRNIGAYFRQVEDCLGKPY